MAVDFDTAAELLRQRLGDRAYEHSVRVARTAVDLAMIYGLDPEPAAVAGLLHDWDKDLDGAELSAAADRCGIRLSAADVEVPALLHSRTGAEGVRTAFPDLSDDVVTAIARHTGGSVDMQPLDMVVYIADKIEPGRTNSAADDLREAAGSLSLEELFAEAFRRSMLHLVRSRRAIHPSAVDVWNRFVPRGPE